MIAGGVAVAAIDPDSPDARAEGTPEAGVAAHYGDPMREQRTLIESVGLVDRSHRGVVAVPGEERLSWLHNVTTQHLADLAAGEGTETLVLSPHGHIEHHAMVAEDGTTTWLDTEPGAAPGLRDFLEKMRFLTRVEPRDATGEYAVLSLVGPEVDTALGVLGVPPLAAPDLVAVPGPKFATGAVPPRPTARYEVRRIPEGTASAGAGDSGGDGGGDRGWDGGWVRRGRLGVDLLVPRPRVPDVVDALTGAGVAVCGLWAYEAVRVAARLPRVGLDTDHRTLPMEIGLVAPSVHLEKGCYRGQETVARVHHLGRPPRKLVLLHLDGITTDRLPPPGTSVTAGGSEAGPRPLDRGLRSATPAGGSEAGPRPLDRGLRSATPAGGRTVGFLGTAVHHAELGPIALAVLRRNVTDDAQLRVGESAAAIDPDPGGSER